MRVAVGRRSTRSRGHQGGAHGLQARRGGAARPASRRRGDVVDARARRRPDDALHRLAALLRRHPVARAPALLRGRPRGKPRRRREAAVPAGRRRGGALPARDGAGGPGDGSYSAQPGAPARHGQQARGHGPRHRRAGLGRRRRERPEPPVHGRSLLPGARRLRLVAGRDARVPGRPARAVAPGPRRLHARRQQAGAVPLRLGGPADARHGGGAHAAARAREPRPPRAHAHGQGGRRRERPRGGAGGGDRG
mmetsp:Transcript_22106/g.68147  ORF Transcript_22106/g.68147 Transcript_22106/m.68147 type:complete len:251 (-) Transcript_22106:30-782(-)